MHIYRTMQLTFKGFGVQSWLDWYPHLEKWSKQTFFITKSLKPCPNISNNLFGGLLFINISIGYYWKERTQFFGYNFAFHQVTIREVSLHVARQVWRRASTFDVWVGALRWPRAETVRKTPWSCFFVCSEFLGHSELVGEIRICGQFV